MVTNKLYIAEMADKVAELLQETGMRLGQAWVSVSHEYTSEGFKISISGSDWDPSLSDSRLGVFMGKLVDDLYD